MKRILFQGDSITDAGRSRDNFYGLGWGYAYLAAGTLGNEQPNEYEFINRGISGNRVIDVYARIKNDFINLKPDYASIYVGVNDVWHEITGQNGLDTEKFEKIYTMLIDEVQAACPGIKLMLIAPYVLEGRSTCSTEEMPDRLERFQKDVAEKAAVTKKLAQKYNFPLIELQPAFDEACKRAPSTYWSGDGVHPSVYGHELIKRLWLETFKKMVD